MADLAITFIKGDTSGSETDYRDLLPTNMTGIVRPEFGADGYMLETPGLTEFGAGDGIDRGGVWNERLQNHFRVSGNQFIEVNAAGSKTDLGSILGADTATLKGFYSFETQGIIADEKFFLFDPVGGFRQVTDPDVKLPIDGVWIDGYYCLTDGEFLYHTEIVAGTPVEDSIAPLALATAEFSPDPTLGVGKTVDNKWIVFNRYSIEFLRNVGGTTFAFQRLDARALKIGLVATHAKAEMKDVWYFMGGRKDEAISVHAMGGGGSQRIASREVEKLIAQYSELELEDVVMETYEMSAYSYLILHLPRETLLFNETLSQTVGSEYAWSLLTTGLAQGTWIAKHGVFEPRVNEWIYGDKTDDKLAFLDENSAEQYGEIQEWYLNTPFIYLEAQSIDEFGIEILPGFTTTKDATVFISTTADGVFYGQEKTMDYGGPSSYMNRFITYRLCYVRDWFSIRLRGASRSRMVFSRAWIKHG